MFAERARRGGDKPIAVDTIMACVCSSLVACVRARALCVCAERVVCARGRCACVQCVCARCVCMRRARMAVHEPVRGARVIAGERVCAREPYG